MSIMFYTNSLMGIRNNMLDKHVNLQNSPWFLQDILKPFSKVHNECISLLPLQPGPILESKGMGAIFQKKRQKNVEKSQNIWKLEQKCTKFEYILRKG